MNNIEKRIREILLEVLPPNEEVNLLDIARDDNLFDYGLDSMNAVALIVSLEDAFGFEFPEEDLILENICKIERIEKYVENRIG